MSDDWTILSIAEERKRKIERLEAELERVNDQLNETLGLYEQVRNELADWQRHGVRVTEDCERCNGGWAGGDKPDPDCPICDGTGKKPRDGVVMVFDDYVIPAELLEAE